MLKITQITTRAVIVMVLVCAMSMSGCDEPLDLGHIEREIQDLKKRVSSLEGATKELERQIKNGALIESVTPFEENGKKGFLITFTGGSNSIPESIEILHGENGRKGDDGVTPLIRVEEKNGKIILAYSLNEGATWHETDVDLRGPQGPEGEDGITPRIKVAEVEVEGKTELHIYYTVSPASTPEEDVVWVDLGVDLKAPASANPLLGIVENDLDGTVTFTLNDEENTEFVFAKYQEAPAGIVIVKTTGDIWGANGIEITFRLNPSTAVVPSTARWQLDRIDATPTRASYSVGSTTGLFVMTTPTLATADRTGQYVTTIKLGSNYSSTTEYTLALILNVGGSLISSSPFTVKAISPAADKDELKDAAVNGGSVTLDSDIMFNYNEAALIVEPGKTLTLDLNGHKLISTGSDKDAIRVNGGTLTIDGDGEVRGGHPTGSNYAVYATGTSDITINGGNYYGNGSCVEIGDGSSNSHILITGGRFEVVYAVTPPGLTLNIHNNATDCSITVSGGTFVNYDPATGDDAIPDDTFIAPGYKSVKISPDPAPYGTFEVVPDVVEINGVVWAKNNVGAPGTFAEYGDAGMFYPFGSKVGSDPTVAAPADYASTANTSGSWDLVNANPCPEGFTIPSAEQFSTLLDGNAVEYVWTTSPVAGYIFTDKVSEEELFISAPGQRINTSPVYVNNNGYYWQNTAYPPGYAAYFYFYENSVSMSNATSFNGIARPVRCVAE